MSKKILTIEDDISIAELEKDYLEIAGFEVEIENSGETGLLLALEKEFDLILLDIMLPGVDGFEICRQIREKKNTPVLIVSRANSSRLRGVSLLILSNTLGSGN